MILLLFLPKGKEIPSAAKEKARKNLLYAEGGIYILYT